MKNYKIHLFISGLDDCPDKQHRDFPDYFRGRRKRRSTWLHGTFLYLCLFRFRLCLSILIGFYIFSIILFNFLSKENTITYKLVHAELKRINSILFIA